jgi:hypothetical protein
MKILMVLTSYDVLGKHRPQDPVLLALRCAACAADFGIHSVGERD